MYSINLCKTASLFFIIHVFAVSFRLRKGYATTARWNYAFLQKRLERRNSFFASEWSWQVSTMWVAITFCSLCFTCGLKGHSDLENQSSSSVLCLHDLKQPEILFHAACSRLYPKRAETAKCCNNAALQRVLADEPPVRVVASTWWARGCRCSVGA